MLGAAATLPLSACSQTSQENPVIGTSAPRVVVVGAGLGGLCCAYRLAQAGVEVEVYEGSDRVGGRVLTGQKLFSDGSVCELGGEFVEADHATLWSLAQELGITLEERTVSSSEGFKKRVFWIGGVEVPEATLVDQLAEVAPAMLAAIQAADSDPEAFTLLDNTTLETWLTDNVPVETHPELRALFATAFRAELGLEPDQQAAFNLLHLVSARDAQSLLAMGNPEHRHRALGGNDAFATTLRSRLTATPGPRLILKSRLVALRGAEGKLVATFEREGGAGFEVEASSLVLALPFSTLRAVDLRGIDLSQDKRDLISGLVYGTGVKLVGAFSSNWPPPGASGAVISDQSFQMVWDGTPAHPAPGDLGLLTNLVGGLAGASHAERKPEARLLELVTALDPLFPNSGLPTGLAVRVHWPSVPLARGSIACLKPGQWGLRDRIGTRESNLHFCGEHCSLDFQGRMEGAAETGSLVAAEILEELGLPLPATLADLIALKGAVRQPGYRRSQGAALMGLLERAERVATSHHHFVRRLRERGGPVLAS